MASTKQQLVTFIIDGFTSVGVHIRDEAKDAYAAIGDDKIWFTQVGREQKCAFTTDHPAVVKYLRSVKDKLDLPLREDLRTMKLRCAQCDFTTDGNTEADQRALAQHIADVHDTEDDEKAPEKPAVPAEKK